MSFITKLLPGATRAIKSYYWLYLAGIALPSLLTQLYLVRDWEITTQGVDFWIILLNIFIPCISGTLAYVDKHKAQ